MGIPEFHDRVVSALLKNIDDLPNPTGSPIATSDLWRSIVGLKKVSSYGLVLLAKLIVSSSIRPFEDHTPLVFSGSTDASLLRAGMLALLCSFNTSGASSFHRLPLACIQASDECAPMNCLLFGLLVDRAGKFLVLPPSSTKFAALLQSPIPDVRAAAAYALGFAKSGAEVPLLFSLFSDHKWHVRYEALISASRLLNLGYYERIDNVITVVKDLENDEVQVIRDAAKSISAQLNAMGVNARWDNQDMTLGLELPDSLLLKLLIASVRRAGFRDVYMTNPFRADDYFSTVNL
jgi:hypothetical protein